MKNKLERINSRITEAEQISELEDRMVEITAKEQRKKNLKKQNSLRDIWDNVKHMNIELQGHQKKRGKRKSQRKYLRI